MAIERQQYFIGQQRIDIPHLRQIESGVAHDFDVLAGEVLAGKNPLVVKGFQIVQTGAVGQLAEKPVLQVAGSIIIHEEAAESGSVFRVRLDRADEVLRSVNPRVQGAFTPGTTNFVGLDLIRSANDSTADIIQILNPDTNQERPATLPLARTLDYKILISTVEFAATPGTLPLAIVTTDSSNQVLSITDARFNMFRLGSGGSNPNPINSFSWPSGRNETVNSISGGDRSINSAKDFFNATMSRIWETGGGEWWYSNTADRNVKLLSTNPFISSGTGFEVVSPSNLHWKGLVILFDNSTGTTNIIQDQITNVTGLTDLVDGECVYVDLDRTQDRLGGNPIIAQKTTLISLGGSLRPGQRWIIAWKYGGQYYERDQNTVNAGPTGANILVVDWINRVPGVGETRLSALNSSTFTIGSTLCWVKSVQDFFRLSAGTALTVDHKTVEGATGATAQWVRLNIPNPFWRNQTQWSIKSTTGDDENLGSGGSSDSFPLATVQEWKRRVRGHTYTTTTIIRIITDITSTIEGDLSSISINSGTLLIFQGIPTVVHSGTLTGTTTASGNIPNSVTNSALVTSWSNTDGAGTNAVSSQTLCRMIRKVGANVRGWVVKDTGSKTARISYPCDLPEDATVFPDTNTVNFATSDLYEVVKFPLFPGVYNSDIAVSSSLRFLTLDFSANAGGTGTRTFRATGMIFYHCAFRSSPQFNMSNSGTQFLNCAFLNTALGSSFNHGGMFASNCVWLGNGTTTEAFFSDCIMDWQTGKENMFQGCKIHLADRSILERPGFGLFFFDNAQDCVLIDLDSQGFVDPLKGNGNSGALINVAGPTNAWAQVNSSAGITASTSVSASNEIIVLGTHFARTDIPIVFLASQSGISA